MSDLDPTPSTRAPKPKWRFWVCSSLLALVVLMLGAIGLWKSNNFVTVKMLDYFVCTGTLDDEPLLAELNFQTDKEVTALIAFADGRHWSLAHHRVENEQHVWDLLDADNNIAGTLRGDWHASTGSFNGQLVRPSGDPKASRVTLKQVAQFEHTVKVCGLRIGPLGGVRKDDELTPRFTEDSPFFSPTKLEALPVLDHPALWKEIWSQVETLTTSRFQPDDVTENVRHLVDVREQGFSAKDSSNIVSGGWRFFPSESSCSQWIQSFVVNDGQLSLIALKFELQKEFSSTVGQQPLRELIYARINAERKRRGKSEVSIPEDALSSLASTRDLTTSFEHAGMRVNFPPQDAGDQEYEFVIPWAEVRRFFRDDSRVLLFMPNR